MAEYQKKNPTVIYLPGEIEWRYNNTTWVLDTAKQTIIPFPEGAHYTEDDMKGACAQLVTEMLAQLESLAAYVDDLETQIGDDALAAIHGDQSPLTLEMLTQAAQAQQAVAGMQAQFAGQPIPPAGFLPPNDAAFGPPLQPGQAFGPAAQRTFSADEIDAIVGGPMQKFTDSGTDSSKPSK